MTKLAVIGIDGVFADQQNIDRVERAFYQGAAHIACCPDIQQTVSSLCQASVERLAAANQLPLSAIHLVLVCKDKQLIINEHYHSITLVANLSEALVKISRLIASKHPIALLGISNQQVDSDINRHQARATISFDQSFTDYHQAQGVASLLISSESFASEHQAYIYSWISAFDLSPVIADAANKALQKASLSAQQIGLIEVSALFDEHQKQREVDGLLKVYSTGKSLNTAISCARSVTGEGGSFSEVAGLLKTIICLQQQYIPGLSEWHKPTEEKFSAWQKSNFYFPTESRPWFPDADNQQHAAAYSCLSENGSCHLILQDNSFQNSSTEVRQNGYLACSDLSLILLAFNEQHELLTSLASIEQSCQIIIAEPLSNNVTELTLKYFEQYKSQQQKYCVALIAETADELVKEINLARTGVLKALANKAEWKTPRGSYFTADPVGDENNVAFFYPGIGATYVGLGRDLFHLFPQIYQPVAALADDIAATLKDTLLNPRSLTALGFKEIKQLDSELRNSLAHIAECGVAFACVFTKIFEQVFNVYADYSAGYSMGEVSMYAALGCWQKPGLMSARLAQSETFNQRLSGELTTLRTLWQLENVSQDERIWETYSIRATLAEVTEAAKDEDRVYCTIINTPDNLLIGGHPPACERVINNLAVRSMAMDMPNAIHSAPAHAEYKSMEQLFTMEVTDRIKTKMFSSSCYLPIPQRSHAIANSIAKCLCDPVDFPRLVNSLYDRGARVFVEMGPGRSLCSWTDKIFKEGDHNIHASVPVNAKGTSDELTYIRALAKLVSHGVNINLEPVFNGSIIVNR